LLEALYDPERFRELYRKAILNYVDWALDCAKAGKKMDLNDLIMNTKCC